MLKVYVVKWTDPEDQQVIILGVTRSAYLAKLLISEDKLETPRKLSEYEYIGFDLIENI